jgi:acetyl-CoA synthetase
MHTFGEAAERAARVANALQTLGAQTGDRVGIMLPNGLEYAVTWLGVLRLGAVVVPINTAYREADLSYVLADSGARLVVTVVPLLPGLLAVRGRCPALERIAFWDGPSAEGVDFGAAVAAAPPGRDPDGVAEGDLAVLQHTSGTTGVPLLGFCGARLAAFKVPRYLGYVDDFPLTPSQRIEKHRLSRELAGAYDAAAGGSR